MNKIFDGKSLKNFPLKSRCIQKYLSLLVFNTVLKVLSNVRRKMCGNIDIGKEESKLYVFADINFRPTKSKMLKNVS